MTHALRARRSLRRRLELDVLEERLALSWGATPPSTVTISSSTPVTLNGQGDASGSAAITNNEVDWYRVQAGATGSYRITAWDDNWNTSNALDTVLGVYNSNRQRIAYNDDAGSYRYSDLNVNLTAGQTYYFGITNYNGTRNGAYHWSVDGPAGATDDAYEENDSIGQAADLGTLTARRTITGLQMRDSQDWFRFTTRGAGTTAHYVQINFTHNAGDLDMRLYNSSGQQVGISDGTGNSERIALNGLAAGTYYVQVYGYNGATNPSYSLDINPSNSSGGSTSGRNVLWVNFDGAYMSRSDLVRYSSNQWFSGSIQSLDPEGDGIRVQRFLANRSDREQIITRIMNMVQNDLQPFGITVRRTTGLAVENQGATTIFIGNNGIGNPFNSVRNAHVACDIDYGNNNRTDIAFVFEESWGSVDELVRAHSDVVLHEAGHTYGLHHVHTEINGSIYLESMGVRYTVGLFQQQGRMTAGQAQPYFSADTSFLNVTFVPFVDAQGNRHGSFNQNSYQTMQNNFAQTSNTSQRSTVTTSNVQAGVFSVNLGAGSDQVVLEQAGNGGVMMTLNGQQYVLGQGLEQLRIYTRGDQQDDIQVRGSLQGVRLQVIDHAAGDVVDGTKLARSQVRTWNRMNLGGGCGCPSCTASAVAGGAAANPSGDLAMQAENTADSALSPEGTPALLPSSSSDRCMASLQTRYNLDSMLEESDVAVTAAAGSDRQVRAESASVLQLGTRKARSAAQALAFDLGLLA